MRDSPAGDRVLQRLRDVRLPDDSRKCLRSETPGKDRVVWIVGIHENAGFARLQAAPAGRRNPDACGETKSYLRMHLKANA